MSDLPPCVEVPPPAEAARRSARRRVFGPAIVAAFFALAPSTVEPWRLDPSTRHAVTLAVGEPVRLLDLERMRRGRPAG